MTDRAFPLLPHENAALSRGGLTQVRRLLKPQPAYLNGGLPLNNGHGFYSIGLKWKRYPFTPGDRLVGKEAWRVGAWHYNNSEIAVDYRDGPRKEWLYVDDSDQMHRLMDQSRHDAEVAGVPLRPDSYYEYTWGPGCGPCRWRSPVTMPRWASRWTLVVTAVKVQRLADATEADARAEGIRKTSDGWSTDVGNGERFYSARDGLHHLWSTIAPGAWERKDWCAVGTVEAHAKNIGEMGDDA